MHLKPGERQWRPSASMRGSRRRRLYMQELRGLYSPGFPGTLHGGYCRIMFSLCAPFAAACFFHAAD